MKINTTKTTDTAATANDNDSHAVVQKKIMAEAIAKVEASQKAARKKASKKNEARSAAKAQPPAGEAFDAQSFAEYQALCEQFPFETIGIDLGDRTHRYCIIDRLGNITEESALDNTREALTRLAGAHPKARFVMEVGTHSPWISSLLLDLGCETFVANARKLKAISESDRKCDQYDARTMGQIGRADTKLLYPITHISQEALKDRSVLSLREQLVNQRKASIQSVRGSLKSRCLRLESCGAEVFPKRARHELNISDPEMLEVFEPMLQAIEAMNQSIKKYDEKIAELSAEKYPATALLRQIKGVGEITALAFVLTIEDPHKMDTTRDVGAYLGLVPGRDQSGERDPQLGITKTGNNYLRKLLTQSAQYILGAFGEDSDLRRAGQRRAAKGGESKKAAKAAKKKAITAVARKLSVVLLALWKSGESYEPLRNSEQINAC
jgi:transposase